MGYNKVGFICVTHKLARGGGYCFKLSGFLESCVEEEESWVWGLLQKDLDLIGLSSKMFHVWGGNHMLQARFPYIERDHHEDED